MSSKSRFWTETLGKRVLGYEAFGLRFVFFTWGVMMTFTGRFSRHLFGTQIFFIGGPFLQLVPMYLANLCDVLKKQILNRNPRKEGVGFVRKMNADGSYWKPEQYPKTTWVAAKEPSADPSTLSWTALIFIGLSMVSLQNICVSATQVSPLSVWSLWTIWENKCRWLLLETWAIPQNHMGCCKGTFSRSIQFIWLHLC